MLLFVLSMNSSVCTAAGQGSLFMHSTPDKPGAADTLVQGRVPGRIAMISGQKTEEEKGRDKIGTSQVKDTQKEPSGAQESRELL